MARSGQKRANGSKNGHGMTLKGPSVVWHDRLRGLMVAADAKDMVGRGGRAASSAGEGGTCTQPSGILVD